jgi:hypothetical protein
MANPRGVVDYEGIGVRRVTYIADGSIVFDSTKANGSAQVGMACQLTAANTVGLTVDGSEVEGRIERVHADGMVVVQREGGCSLPGGDGATLTPGTKIVGALRPGGGGGGIRTAAASAAEAALARGVILDASTTTAVKVMLD